MMVNLGDEIIMYGDAIFRVINKYPEFKAIPKSVFPTSPEDFWDFSQKEGDDYKKDEPYAVVQCVDTGGVKIKYGQRFIMPERKANRLAAAGESSVMKELRKLIGDPLERSYLHGRKSRYGTTR